MARSASARRPFRRPQLVWAILLTLTSCALACTVVASATAKRDRPQQASSTPAPQTAPAAPAPAGGKAQAPPAQGANAQACCAAQPGPASEHKGHAPARANGKPHRQPAEAPHATGQLQGAAAPSSEQGSDPAPAGQQEAGLAPAATRPGHKKVKQNNRKESTPKGSKVNGSKVNGSKVNGSTSSKELTGKQQEHGQPAIQTATPASAARVSSAPSGPVPLAPTHVAPAATTPPRVVGESPAAASGSAGGRGLRRTRRATRRPASASAPLAQLAPAAQSPAAAVPAARAERAPVASRRTAPRTQSQLVTTVTRIIGVVPTLVWTVIGALAALALALGASSRLVARRARRLARHRRELLEDVGLLQAALLPELPGRLGPVGTSAAYRPASGPGAGGDFYDVFALADGQIAVIVGDVSGHGRQALPRTTLLRFTLRAYLEAGLSPRGALQAATPVLERQLGSSFATVVLATYEPRDRILVYACAGHPPPVVMGTRSIAALTACSSPPIGAGQPTGRRQTVVSVPGGALACFYTDGVIEARVGQELFGARRLEQTLAELGPQTPASTVLDRVAERSDRHPDDMAACLLRIEGDQLAPAVEVEELELDRRDLARGRAERFLLAGGVNPAEIGEILGSVRAQVARHGGVVLELHLAEGPPWVALRPQNVARLQAPAHANVGAHRMTL
jgi:serine phosphatase RsbU (regulator of sigma subunit)